MKRSAVIIGIAFALASLFPGCRKGTMGTDVKIRLMEEIRPGEAQVLANAEVWAAHLDTAEWYIASYEDLIRVAGPPLATSKHNPGETRAFDVEVLTEDFSHRFEDSPVMLVAFARNNLMYVSGAVSMVKDLSSLSIVLTFKPWMNIHPKDTAYYQGANWHWKFVNGNTKVPVECMYSIYPRIERQTLNADNSTKKTEEKFAGLSGYMLAGADTLEWTVASAADARAGRLTSKADGSVKREFKDNSGDQRLQLDAEGNILFTITGTERRIMFILADNNKTMYAFGGAELAKNPKKSESEKIVFNPHVADTTYYMNESSWGRRWKVVNEGITPDPINPPEPPETP